MLEDFSVDIKNVQYLSEEDDILLYYKVGTSFRFAGARSFKTDKYLSYLWEKQKHSFYLSPDNTMITNHDEKVRLGLFDSEIL